MSDDTRGGAEGRRVRHVHWHAHGPDQAHDHDHPDGFEGSHAHEHLHLEVPLDEFLRWLFGGEGEPEGGGPEAASDAPPGEAGEAPPRAEPVAARRGGSRSRRKKS